MLQLLLPNTSGISRRCSGCHFWPSFITVVIQAHPSLMPEHQVVLHSRIWPAAIALNYSVKNIWNDVRQKPPVFIYSKCTNLTVEKLP